MSEVTNKYFEASKLAFEKVDEIHTILYAHGRKFDGLNFGYVGDLNNLNNQLDEIIKQLKTSK